MKRGWIPIMGVCLVLSFSACKQLLPYQDTSLTAEQRAEDLLPRLTLEEKYQSCKMRHLLSLDWELKNMSGGMRRCTVWDVLDWLLFSAVYRYGSFF